MIVTCPDCSKRYLVDDTLFQKPGYSQGHKVRCASCKHIWWQQPPSIPQGLEAISSEPLPTNFGGAQAVSKSLFQRLHFDWLILSIATASIIMAIYIERDTLVNFFPSLNTIYKWFGTQVPSESEGLSVQSLRLSLNSAQNNYIISGEIQNISDQLKKIPELNVVLWGPCPKDLNPEDQQDLLPDNIKSLRPNNSQNVCMLATWPYRLTNNSILPKEKLIFQTTVPHNVTGEPTVVKVSFKS